MHGEANSLARKTGTLYVVATPIGNLEDITLRAVRVLGEVDLIAAEDTRHTRKLLSHLDIHTPLVSYYKDKEVSKADTLIADLLVGKDVALVSDAGTPGISDPGAILVAKARQAGVRVEPVPGPSALIATLSVAGLQDSSFVFLGFLPAKKNERRNLLYGLRNENRAMVFYESPKRISSCLRDCEEIFSERWSLVARELTKIHEEILEGTLVEISRILADKVKIKGEFVVVVAGAQVSDEKPDSGEVNELLVWCRDSLGLSLRDAVKKITGELGASRSEVYKQALDIWGEGRE
ncbi:MAG: 16S rRNA (cytidine(1402)-2'-O)-methyltransferase [Proteobacteria bacterium]|nr:16S rRNA (cytidine(1402)-2'-O)-methyltransferase [Pseudomonadota bacterium]MBU1714626.1 16S rRNA (cytidine(1402)-2'-O)-methyltransferase [Pseudomonadota bacterium]